MVILSANPFDLEKSKLNELKVEKTILGGKEYRPQKQSLIKILFKGLFSKNKY